MVAPSTEARESVCLSVVVPVFNEAETVDLFIDQVSRALAGVPGVDVEFVFVNDGSVDATLDVLLARQKTDDRLRVVDLSRNFGKEAALTAGLFEAAGDVIVPIDVDLQDPPDLIPQMLAKWRDGYEVVLGRRVNRDSDGWAKRASANWFYRLHNRMAEPKLPENVGDFRLMDRSVAEALKSLPESRRFMKGLFAWVGFRTTHVDYTRAPRAGGQSKFNGWKLWNFALEGITSFSTDPLRIWTYIGIGVSLLSFLYATFIVIHVVVNGVDAPGFASIIVAVTFLGGLQLIGIGILGEYLGRTYIESKRRPSFLIRRIYTAKKD